MRKMLLLLLVLHSGVWANEEITVDLLGGATMDFVWIDPGTFTMGSPETEENRGDDEGPQHKVTISSGFYLGSYEVTQEQWESVMGTTPWSGKINVESDSRHPAVYISWHNVQTFIHALNVAAGDSLYRLPSESEREYSARAGTTMRWSFGDDESQLGDYAWYRENAWSAGLQYGQPVGTKLPNPWGLYDMHGNAYEWCQDWHGEYSSGAQVDPQGVASGSARVVRGGAFGGLARVVRSAKRLSVGPGFRNAFIGFRLLRMGSAPTAVTPQSWGQIKDGVR